MRFRVAILGARRVRNERTVHGLATQANRRGEKGASVYWNRLLSEKWGRPKSSRGSRVHEPILISSLTGDVRCCTSTICVLHMPTSNDLDQGVLLLVGQCNAAPNKAGEPVKQTGEDGTQVHPDTCNQSWQVVLALLVLAPSLNVPNDDGEVALLTSEIAATRQRQLVDRGSIERVVFGIILSDFATPVGGFEVVEREPERLRVNEVFGRGEARLV